MGIRGGLRMVLRRVLLPVHGQDLAVVGSHWYWRCDGCTVGWAGIVEEMGSVVRLEQEEQDGQVGWTLEVKAAETLGGAKVCTVSRALPPTCTPS